MGSEENGVRELFRMPLQLPSSVVLALRLLNGARSSLPPVYEMLLVREFLKNFPEVVKLVPLHFDNSLNNY
jgi:hypothetical protein